MVGQFVIEVDFLSSRAGGWVPDGNEIVTGYRELAQIVADTNDHPCYMVVGVRPLGGNRRVDLVPEMRALHALESPDGWKGARFEWVTV